MSATLREDNRNTLKECLGVTTPALITGSLARRNVTMQCVISGDKMATIKLSAKENLKQDQHTQILLHSNSKTIFNIEKKKAFH